MPDLNSLPPSLPPSSSATPRRRTSSNLTSQARIQMPPPPAPISPSLNILPSNQQPYHHSSSSSLSSPPLPGSTIAMAPHAAPGQDNTGVGPGPGPLRHPHPLTAAELHQELEAEQELLVNRLTRELSLLRAAHNSSVVSNTSSTSASTTDQGQSSFTDTHMLSGPGFPIPSTSADRRHNRTGSTASTRSQRSLSQAATAGSTPASVLEAARHPRGGMSMSRQDSTTSHRSSSRSRNRSPHPHIGSGSYSQPHGFSHLEHSSSSSYFPRGNPTSSPHSTSVTPGSELSPGLMPATVRYEETAHYRQELDNAKRENEMLRRRIRELEKMVRDRRESDASRGSTSADRLRSESVSTLASVSVTGAAGMSGGGANIAGDRRDPSRGLSTLSTQGSVGIGVPEEELKVGESAASAGLGHEAK